MPGPAFQRVEELFQQAVLLDPSERAAFLDAACAGDAELRAAVENLLRHDEEKPTDLFLISPVAREAERLRPGSATQLDPAGGGMTAAPPPDIPGYEILAELGRGGMGVVYKARQTNLHRIVALKMLLDGSATPNRLARFRAEADALARLQHPNIVPIYEIGEWQGRPYFTMEYVAGPSLAEVLAGRPQDGSASARLVEELARAMHAVHQSGLIHRDLKPSNVLLQRTTTDKNPLKSSSVSSVSSVLSVIDSVPKITDFGLAKDPAAGPRLTQSGVALGTPSYMAPEQAWNRGRRVGPPADIYALGAILYEMLTGRPPFDADTPTETIVQLLQEEPLSPARLRPGLPRDLVTICLKCLEKAPRRRYATAWDLAEDLRRFQAGEPIRARPVGVIEHAYRWTRRHPLVAALLALSASLATALVITVLVYDALLQQALATTRALAEDERRQLVQLDLDDGVRALDDEDLCTAAFFFEEALRFDQGFPEGKHRTRIATTLRLCPELLATRTLDAALLQEPLLGAALSPDGSFLAVVGASGTVRIVDLRTEAARPLAVAGGAAVRHLTFHADARLLITEQANGQVRSWEITGQNTATPPGHAVREASLSAVSDNGRWLFTLDSSHRGEVCDVATGKTTAAPLQLGQDVSRCAISPDGRRLALIGPDNALTVWDLPGARALGKPMPLPPNVNQIVFSPDDDHVLTACADRSAQVWQVPTGELRASWSRLDGPVTHAHFSPDGRLVLLGDGAGQVRVWDAVTGQPAAPPLRHAGPLALAAFHDGARQVVTVGVNGVVCWWHLPAAPAVGDAASVGGGLAAAADAALPHERRVIHLENGVTVSADATTAGVLSPPGAADKRVEHAVFSPQGDGVAVCENDSTVRVWDTATGAARTPPLHHRGVILYGAFSPDGRRLLTASNDQIARVWDAATGEVLTPPLHHGRAIKAVFFYPNGDRACVLHEGGVVTAWDLTPDVRPIEELRSLVQGLVRRR
jgi:eukaryotic-like serine/threonine-protein kinase